ncbi:hypothetical protein HELRODRAFT_127755, partial [Helobdella robusta]|uniref:Disintegrin domain-containing protein n=1 Tax=Helobdella robusta TaxID=6412 RepID=T1EHH4_HELRO
PARCGNGLIDEGEDCDCSLFPATTCSSECCDSRTCKFRPGSECATGLCCDFNTCKIISAGVVCRLKQDECDLQDTCDGRSNLCKDLYIQDGSMCTVSN